MARPGTPLPALAPRHRSDRPTFRHLLIAAVIAAAIAGLTSGCGGDETRTAVNGLSDQRTVTYSTSPESTSRLLKDASDAIKAMSAAGKGVRFQMDALSSDGSRGTSVCAQGEMAGPDKLRMTTRDFPAAEPVETEVIVLAGKAYSRLSGDGNAWHGGFNGAKPPDPQHLAAFMDYTRSSHNFGQETLPGGRKAWHIQMDVDMTMLTEDELRSTTEPARAAELEAATSTVVTADYWIGEDDLLPYQATIKASNKISRQSTEQNLIFSNWGELFEIAKPCEAC